MSENTAKLLEELATKLGTTTEYLWQALLRQAPLSSAWSVAMLVAFGILSIYGWKVFLKNWSKWDKEQDIRFPIGLLVLALVLAIVSTSIIVVLLVDGPRITAGFFNPEYWAMKEVLTLIKR